MNNNPNQAGLRPARQLETRESQSRNYTYRPPSSLPDVIESPEWAFRWIATVVAGSPDVANVHKRMADQWEPVPFDAKDKVLKQADAFPTIARNTDGNIVIGGLMLCRMPKERANARDKYYRDLTARQIQGVKQQNGQQFDQKYTKLEQSTTAGVNGGREVEFGS